MEAKSRTNRSAIRVLTAMCVMLAGPAWAQQKALVGRVLIDDAEVRAGAGDSYYVVGHLKKGSIVNIVDRFFEWYKVTPPQGVYSYVAKNRVDASDDGKTGVVTRDRTPVKAASVDGPGKSYRRQLDLFKGDKVAIVDAEGDRYKIVPPRSAYVFVLVSSVKREAFVPAPNQAPVPPVAMKPAPPAVTPIKPKPVVAKVTPPAPAPAKPVVNVSPAPPLVPAPAPPTMVTGVIESPRNTTGEIKAMPLKTANAAIETVAQPAPAPKPTVQVARGTPQIQPEPGSAPPASDDLPTFRSRTPPPKPKPVIAPPASPASPAPPAAAPRVVNSTPAAPAEVTTTLSSNVALASLSLEQLNGTLPAIEQLPLERQPIADLLAAYEGHYQNTQLSATQRREVLMQIIRLRRNAALATTLQEIAIVQRSLDIAPVTTVSLAGAGAAPPQRVEYDAMGQLVASGVYDGVHLPRLYRLVSPSMRTVVYLRPNDSIDATAMMGKIVGVYGPARYDPALKLRVLEAERIDLLKPEAMKQTDAG